MKQIIDLRSDTVTQPTQEMREAIYNAVVGDDILGEDPTVKQLESLAAEMLGKEDGLFVSSGTMANQIAVMTFTNRGEEVIVGDTSHIYNLEVGGLAALSQVQTRPISVPNGIYDIEFMEELIQEEGIQAPKTGLICIENTNNLNAGLVVPLHNINEVCNLAEGNGIPVYMDGARIFNAAVALDIDVKEIVKNVDAVMFALTKGLAAPFGAVLLGNKKFIKKARWIKQRIGGGYRQAGFVAASGIIALKTMIPRISIDHDNAKLLGNGLSNIKGLIVDITRIHTNIISGSIEMLPITIEDFLSKLLNKGIKAKRISKTSFRMVTHWGIDESHINYVIESVKDIINNL
ncbi:aminotransferase class I/II-fold pyridoxal phosphate-dependent enzyme [Schnuerera sp. xch1]|uniref:threonine aldolase family protein n=1 Tax=Schnuerera sp. xch1 TaxID=2874283 RepID=UPI001CBE5AEF|nr:GntG family PLP-dependent aldolase [Schnuerera sp. xch1]MBZ2174125.1 aminotransferase class I/II-fold pyridoxal phosphate-dependent enzyme [Schnuerera sp. xch1]